MLRHAKSILLLISAIGSIGIGAQPGPTPENPWLLADYRPVLAVQFCNNPRIVGLEKFDSGMEECTAEFDRLFVKCTTELPNVSLPAKFENKEEQAAGVALLYECMSSHYIGGETLEEFNQRHPVDEKSNGNGGE